MEQDSRFYNKDKKLLKSMKFPPNIGTKVIPPAHYMEVILVLAIVVVGNITYNNC